MKEYKAIIWDRSAESVGIRTTVWAKDSEEAVKAIEKEFGSGKIVSIWNEEDAKKLR